MLETVATWVGCWMLFLIFFWSLFTSIKYFIDEYDFIRKSIEYALKAARHDGYRDGYYDATNERTFNDKYL
jgi:hypothetical protein